MRLNHYALYLVIYLINIFLNHGNGYTYTPPITISILFRNKEQILDHFFHYIEDLDYPKSNIHLFLRCDNSYDATCERAERWAEFWRNSYASIDEIYYDEAVISEASLSTNWTNERQLRVRNHMNDAQIYAKTTKSKYWFHIDADVLLINRNTIRMLISRFINNPDIVMLAPLIDCPSRNDFFNFWLNIHPNNLTFALVNSTLETEISQRKRTGLFKVGLVHSAFMMRMDDNGINNLDYKTDPHPPEDKRFFPIISLVNLLKMSNNLDKIYLDNQEFYGYLPTPVAHDSDPEFEIDSINHMKLQIGAQYLSKAIKDKKTSRIQFNDILQRSLHSYRSPKSDEEFHETYGVDEMYVLNLNRRQERRKYMQFAFDILQLRGRLVNSIDGQNLNKVLLNLLKIKQLKGYLDPSFKRPMTFGEVACFLSHYFVWQDMVEKNVERAIILEDDVRFSIFFNQGITSALYDADHVVKNWDLMYLGRKALRQNETNVNGSKILIKPKYSYWTIGYVLNLSGAKKLLSQNPLQKLLPVDEFLPIMFDEHPNKNWTMQFEERNLIALATKPMLIEPLFYKGDEYYSSDTERSDLAFEYFEC